MDTGSDRRVLLACAWCGPVFLLAFLVGFGIVGGLVPPPKPSASPARVAAFYRDNTDQLRAGTLIAMISQAAFRLGQRREVLAAHGSCRSSS